MVQFRPVTSRGQDDGFHEIQLSGKQLVFLFMAASVVAGVIFLLGVFVGRGVRAERGTIAQAAALSEAPLPDAARMTSSPTGSVPGAAEPNGVAPPMPVDDLSYFARLDKEPKDSKTSTPTEQPAAEKSPAAKTVSAPPPALPLPVAPAGAVVAANETGGLPTGSGVPGDGYAVQVAALNVRSEADAIAKRLMSKGYAAYVQVPPGAASVFRVRVGTFKTKRDAESVAAWLQKEERITPWVTR